MTNTFKYYAFISYKREDERWAKWLQRKLEDYRIPTALRKRNPDLPERVRPIFKDTTDLSGGVLEQAINEALEQSKYLIVICSPRATQSPWVCKEVQRFIDLGKEEYIIPFIVDGTPFSNDATECFPTALKALSGEKELLGININENGQDAAAIKVVARMFNVNFDTLWQRHRRAEKRKRRIIAAVASLFTLCVLAVAGYIWQKNVELQKKNDTIAQQNEQIKAESGRANQERDRAEAATDSIRVQEQLLLAANNNLSQANNRILQERDGMLRAQSRAVAAKAIELAEKGDSYTARLLALSILPKDLEHPDRPYTPEAEAALRLAVQYNSAIISGFPDAIWEVSFSPDGKYIVAALFDHTIRIIDASTGKQIGLLLGHENEVSFASFSPDGKKIISASIDGTVRIWDVETHKQIKQLAISEGITINAVSFSPDGKQIMLAQALDSCRIWDSETYNELY